MNRVMQVEKWPLINCAMVIADCARIVRLAFARTNVCKGILLSIGIYRSISKIRCCSRLKSQDQNRSPPFYSGNAFILIVELNA